MNLAPTVKVWMGEETREFFFFCVFLYFEKEKLIRFFNFAPQFLWGFFSGVNQIENKKYLNMAFAEAAKGKGRTWLNPLVGAVIVKNGQVLACGYHDKFGGDHAEIAALNHLKNPDQAFGAAMYVSLEPCSHYGKRPPCAQRLVEVGISEVIIGQKDPNPLVAGKGILILEKVGIKVTVLDLDGHLNQAYNFFYRHHRPLITLKWAMSLDGKINAAGQDRTMISGEAAYQDSQDLRATQQAILIGSTTAMIDNPRLTVRTQQLCFPPIKIVLIHDPDQLPVTSRLLSDTGPVWLLATQASLRKWPAHIQIKNRTYWSIEAIVQLLTQHGIQALLVEGGSHTFAAFFASGFVDRTVAYVSPFLLGGDGLPAMKGPAGVKTNFQWQNISQIGSDLRIEARRQE